MPAWADLVFIATLGAVSVVDLRERRIPNRATGLAAGVAVLVMLLEDPSALPMAVVAAAVVSLPLLLACLVNPAGMGMGDVKLMAVIGLYLGWVAVPVLLAGLLAATVAGVVISVAGRRKLGEITLPLAPFLAAASVYPLAKLLEFPLH